MITRKSKIQYEVIVDYEELQKIREKYIKEKYIISTKELREGTAKKESWVNYILYNVNDLRYHLFFTTKQYELFKRLRYETKNKK